MLSKDDEETTSVKERTRVPLSKSSEKDATSGEFISPMTTPAPTALTEGTGMAGLPLKSSTAMLDTEANVSLGELPRALKTLIAFRSTDSSMTVTK